MTTFTTQDRQDAQRTPLTDSDLAELADKFLYQIQVSYEEMGLYDFARAIERAHGIGESND
jgi:hypothetical protein